MKLYEINFSGFIRGVEVSGIKVFMIGNNEDEIRNAISGRYSKLKIESIVPIEYIEGADGKYYRIDIGDEVIIEEQYVKAIEELMLLLSRHCKKSCKLIIDNEEVISV